MLRQTVGKRLWRGSLANPRQPGLEPDFIVLQTRSLVGPSMAAVKSDEADQRLRVDPRAAAVEDSWP
jgi:hypothetical protein